MKKILQLISFSFISLSCMAQSNIRLNHYWENPYYITPAYINTQYPAVFSMAGRKQWVTFDGAPTTFIATANLYSEEMHSQFGAKIFQDQIGYTSTTNLSLSYTYAATLSEIWRLQLGVAGVYQRLSYDASKIILDNNSDNEAFNNLQPETYFNTDIGAELASRSLRIGIASQNFASLFNKNNALVNTNFLYGAFRTFTENPVDFGVGVCGIQYSRMIQTEFNATAYFKTTKDEPDKFQVGAFYRTPGQLGAIAGVNISKALSVFYSYEYSMNSIKHHSLGSHEIMIVYKLKKGPVCYSCF